VKTESTRERKLCAWFLQNIDTPEIPPNKSSIVSTNRDVVIHLAEYSKDPRYRQQNNRLKPILSFYSPETFIFCEIELGCASKP